ncbi:hypothetical protein SEA_NUEVOMUNDO_81 [Mycobacterium phage NuevoMundo]|uniref:Uncharacterized protein n=3 Tax=Bixzunavirus TaxID=680114 RepID=A0A411CCP3_9CAUD|nr:hypothetical protein KHO62_gp078 [Mycobacterium phage NoodleTree]YP_010510487.1 hypothetical protein OLP41_gp079 [Mycobacterium phage I3]AFL46769.1 hypothetical protein AVA3_76 [Mycobacterium phage Ava3]AVJ48356.1 hypothetical protein SEA_NUEVOMUNDO_81 [Mycobacterium phage NuevoMundo]AVJ48588.1 hypothetical protein SEA_PIER_79 [Mycobacterium phage Pier]QAY14013.1 hypothetical protein SEA_COLT_65 [Mycobacterium phage Colt]UTQ77879.1 hypothetical protein [Mycolicibacterium phage Kashi_SSH1]
MIFARPVWADNRKSPLPDVIPLREAPFAGDGIRLQNGAELLVIRRTFLELPADPAQASGHVDLILIVREK